MHFAPQDFGFSSPSPRTTLRKDDYPSLAGKKILVIDDVADSRLLAKQFIARCGGEVEFAENGLEGYRKALRFFDVILMDLQMPLMDGYEAVQILRKWGIETPIIAWTAHASIEDRENCLRMGFDDYVPKPINWHLLLSKIVEHSTMHASGLQRDEQKS